MLEDNTGVQRLYIAYGLGGIIVLWLAFGFGAQVGLHQTFFAEHYPSLLQLLANIVGFVYPAYCSIKALESTVKNDDTQWLTYWVVFAAFSVVEYFADFIAGWVGVNCYIFEKSTNSSRCLSTGSRNAFSLFGAWLPSRPTALT